MQEDGSRRDFADSSPWMQPLYAAQGDGAAVFDLRALRPFCSRERARTLYPELCKLVFQYDALLLLPEFHRSTEIVPTPRR